MRLLLLAAMAMAIGATTTHAHENAVPLNTICISSGDTISADSLQKLYRHIDLLSVFDLNKWRESYIYKNRTQPSDLNKQILAYIEERLKVIK